MHFRLSGYDVRELVLRDSDLPRPNHGRSYVCRPSVKPFGVLNRQRAFVIVPPPPLLLTPRTSRGCTRSRAPVEFVERLSAVLYATITYRVRAKDDDIIYHSCLLLLLLLRDTMVHENVYNRAGVHDTEFHSTYRACTKLRVYIYYLRSRIPNHVINITRRPNFGTINVRSLLARLTIGRFLSRQSTVFVVAFN